MKAAEGRSAAGPPSEGRFLLPGLAGAYVNSLAYGFHYGAGNHEFELPLVNWLRNPSLYPHDAIRASFTRLPTLFWPVVAYLSRWASTEHVVFFFFLLTKVLFFLALARLLSTAVADQRLAVCIVLAVALSPFLNDFTPFGASDVLDNIQTSTSLAIALLLWVGVFLIEERWWPAAVLYGLSVYLNALFVVYTLPAFAVFAARGWRRRRATVATSSLLGAAIALPWLFQWRSAAPGNFPAGYVKELLAFFPMHLTLRSHSTYDLLCGTGLLIAAVWMMHLARQAGLQKQTHLELLAGSYLFPVLLGALGGKFFLTPELARLQLLRADTFLVLYAVLLIQILGANLLIVPEYPRRATAMLLGLFAILLPLSTRLELLVPLLVAMLLAADPHGAFEFICYRVMRGRMERLGPARRARIVSTVCFCGLALAAYSLIPGPSRLWNFKEAPTPLEADWFAAQQWARTHTPPEAQFLVPTYPCGFRVFSERGSWGEWRDGTLVYLDPSFTEVYRQRMEAIGLRQDQGWVSYEVMEANYKRQSWERLQRLARENQLSYVVQFRDANYTAAPLYANRSFAVYSVTP